MTHALRGAGLEVELVEQTDEARSTGYQLNVMANGLYALAKLELLEPLMASGCGVTMRSAPILDGATGRLVRRIRTVYGPNDEWAHASFYRGDVHQVLLEAMRGPGPQRGRKFRSFRQEAPSEKVVVEFADGRSDAFDLLVGADGAHSEVRQQLFPGHPRFEPRLASLLFAASIDLDGTSEAEQLFAEQIRREEFTQFIAPGTAVILRPARGASASAATQGRFPRHWSATRRNALRTSRACRRKDVDGSCR